MGEYNEIRIQKYISQSGVCSRRLAEKYIDEGKVKINGKTVTEQGLKINPETDRIEINGKLIKNSEKKVYILLNKPVGYVCTAKEQFNRPSVLDLVKIKERVYPVGRLDMYSSGLLILTNDGELTNKLTHPKNDVYKKYVVCIKGKITEEEIYKLKQGVDIGDYITRPCSVEHIKDQQNGNSVIAVKISEGKYRQVRKMFEAIERHVLSLKRVKEGSLALGELEEGKWRYLTEKEVKELWKN